MHRAITGILTLSLLALVGCVTDDPGPGDDTLLEATDAALEAAIEYLDDIGLGTADDEGRGIDDGCIDLVGQVRADASLAAAGLQCDREGLFAGIWRSANEGNLILGHYFEIGGEGEGSLDGSWAPLDCAGCPEGSFHGEWQSIHENRGEFDGFYEDGHFAGDWIEVENGNADDDLASGEMIGFYRRVDESGGYFIGLYSVCDEGGENGPGNDGSPDGEVDAS